MCGLVEGVLYRMCVCVMCVRVHKEMVERFGVGGGDLEIFIVSPLYLLNITSHRLSLFLVGQIF